MLVVVVVGLGSGVGGWCLCMCLFACLLACCSWLFSCCLWLLGVACCCYTQNTILQLLSATVPGGKRLKTGNFPKCLIRKKKSSRKKAEPWPSSVCDCYETSNLFPIIKVIYMNLYVIKLFL